MFWLIRYLWRRIADYFTAVDVLDWLEWKTWIVSVSGAAVTGGIAAALDTPPWVIFALCIAGACIGLGLLIIWQNWKNDKPISSWQRKEPKGYTALHEAARMFYEASEAGKLPKIPKGSSEQLSGWSDDGGPIHGSPDDILQWWAAHLSKNLAIYGVRPPSTTRKQIDESVVRNFLFCEGATKLKNPLNETVYYTDLTVKTKELQVRYEFETSFHGVQMKRGR